MSEAIEFKFIVRVVLHGVEHESEAYGMLHMAMRDCGFRALSFDPEDGTRYQLPPAEYLYVGATSRKYVFGVAAKAVHSIGWEVGPEHPGAHRAAVMVTQSAGITFDGLAAVADDQDV